MPRSFVIWVMENFHAQTKSLRLVKYDELKITEEDAEQVYGLPRGQFEVDLTRGLGASLKCSQGRSLGLPHFTKGNAKLQDVKLKLVSDTNTRKWREQFVVYAFESMLCHSGNQLPALSHLKYMQQDMIQDFEKYN
ncbi:unnamed protein product [Linum trigynum]|uniref:Uncharacterized protein n=1 Tax=Linum trigynum TaxID=586398 RepID=A0AAV2GA08_9ROSI